MPIGDLYDANNVVVGQAAVIFAPANTALPDPTTAVMTDPFSLTPFNTVPGTWTPCGATDQGWKFSAKKDTTEVNVEEQSTPVATNITKQTVALEGALSEDVSATLALVLNATTTATAAGAGTPGYDSITIQDAPVHYAAVLLTSNDKGFPRWIYIPDCVSLNDAEVSFRRASDKRMYNCVFSSVCNIDLIQVINFTAVGT